MGAVERPPILLPTMNLRGSLLRLLLRHRPANQAVAARSWVGCLRTRNSTWKSIRLRCLAPTVAEVPPRPPLRSPKFLSHCHLQCLLPAMKEAAAPRRPQDQIAPPLFRNVPPRAAEARQRPPLPARAAHPSSPADPVPAGRVEEQSRCWRPARAACGRLQYLEHPPAAREHPPVAILAILFFVHSRRAGEEPLPH